jgi:hypothetical protein
MNKTEKKLIRHLRELGAGKINPKETEYGICCEIENVFSGIGCVINYGYYYDMWPKFSGNYAYPVPYDGMSPGDAFDYTTNLWDGSQYGEARRELCLFLADKLEEGANLGAKP